MPQPFTYHRAVEFADTDAAGIVHFTALIRYMESAEHAFLRQCQTSVMPQATREIHDSNTVNQDHLSWPRVRIETEFESVAYFEDRLAITVAVEKLGRSSVTYAFKISLADHPNHPLICTGNFTTVCCNFTADGKLKATPIPETLREKFLEHTLQRPTNV